MEVFFTNILAAIISSFNLPSVALMVLFFGAFYVLHSAQKREDFDLGNMFKNDSGKESAISLGTIIAIILSGWVLVYDTIGNHAIDATIYSIYLGIWSGTSTAAKLLEVLKVKWSGPSTSSEPEPTDPSPKPSDKV